MPTVDDYRSGASRFRAIAEQLFREAGAQRAWARSSYMGHGLVRTPIDDSLALAHADLVAAGEELSRLASVCDRRAEVCADYRRAWLDYWRMSPFERLVSPHPARPAYWADP